VYKIAIAGASTLLGRELKEVLSESPLATANFVLLDEEEAQGQLDQVGDEVTFVQAIDAESFDRADFTFFAGTEAQTRKYWRAALRAGSTVLDLSGALDQETGVLVRAPWLGSEAAAVDLFTPAVVPAHPAALALALLLERLQQAAPVRFAAVTLLEPASGFGRAAMDELHQQTVSLLSFQALPRATYDAQVAYNLLSGLGESSTINLGAEEARIRRHYAALGDGRWPALAVAGHSRAGLPRPCVLDCRGAGACGGYFRARRSSERRACGPGAGRYGFALESRRHRAERRAGAPASGEGGPQSEPDVAAMALGRLRQSAPARAECRGVRSGSAEAAAGRGRCSKAISRGKIVNVSSYFCGWLTLTFYSYLP
jgi:hypothetical protein